MRVNYIQVILQSHRQMSGIDLDKIKKYIKLLTKEILHVIILISFRYHYLDKEVIMTNEKQGQSWNGWIVLTLHLIFMAIGLWLLLNSAINEQWSLPGTIAIIVLFAATLLILPLGYFTLQPNEAKVLVLFGKYKGTVRKDGFHWTNPLQLVQPRSKYTLSLRIRNFEIEKLKVNDKRGNPIEIAAVVVWHIENTANALFDVDHYEHYVKIQSDAALRHLANCYPYDHGEEEEMTLRSGMDEVALVLKEELQTRLAKAGVRVEETRLTHLAYAPEIANAMLRRQQAEAIIAARRKIVHGAVSMVEMALEDLKNRKVVDLDEDRKAAMVSNLLVVLCGEAEVSPIINTGTLYK